MSGNEQELAGPDLASGVATSDLADGASLLGHVDGEAVLLVRRGSELFAIGATCTHYGGPRAEGLVVDDTVRCPWHHACFSLRTGEAEHAPALKALACWHVERRGGKAIVAKKMQSPGPRPLSPKSDRPGTIVIVGGGAAGNAAAEALRRASHSGRITMLSADTGVPSDRPTLSKSYLA